MKKMIMCDTLYQIMLAIQLKLTLFKEDEVDIWISDHSAKADRIAENIRKIGLFRNVIFDKNKKIIYSKGIFLKFKNVLFYGMGKNIGHKIDDYDEIVFYSMSILVYGINRVYQKKHHKVVWSRFEEGILSYDTDFAVGKAVLLLEFFYRLQGRRLLRNSIKNYYCVFPELKGVNRGWNLIRIPGFNVNEEEIKGIFSIVFDYKEKKLEGEFIYFASSSDIDGKAYGETELIFKIAEIVGRDKLIVKKHPRDTRTIYTENGIKELKSDGIPWEVYQICGDIKGKTLITVDSGSFFSISVIQNSDINGLFLFPCLGKQRKGFEDRDRKIRELLVDLHELKVCKNISVINRLEELKSYIR